MEEVKVSELPLAESVNDEDLVMIVQDGYNKKVSKEVFKEDVENKIQQIETNIENISTYSNNETVVGNWINGKPIYRKAVSGTISAAYGTIMTCNNIEDMIDGRGQITLSSGIKYPIVFANTNSNDWVAFYLDGDNIHIHTKSDYVGRPYLFILEYTKTTD